MSPRKVKRLGVNFDNRRQSSGVSPTDLMVEGVKAHQVILERKASTRIQRGDSTVQEGLIIKMNQKQLQRFEPKHGIQNLAESNELLRPEFGHDQVLMPEPLSYEILEMEAVAHERSESQNGQQSRHSRSKVTTPTKVLRRPGKGASRTSDQDGSPAFHDQPIRISEERKEFQNSNQLPLQAGDDSMEELQQQQQQR